MSRVVESTEPLERPACISHCEVWPRSRCPFIMEGVRCLIFGDSDGVSTIVMVHEEIGMLLILAYHDIT